ncbi:N-acetylneuraminate synthase [Moorella thermoacetica]|uniref:N-acetylneuraminate synthase n=1 Tax=Moorella thermoacetica (strain ATCC 39073 / JCM 9320) TaxID=264732 RepID=Q2RKG5_MOOTA|nr:N-acetylneuraminate synthase [Moorella thermoacetica]AKX93504.1 N,N'-diacetyllegionaminic acid synthase [Moorella thermoacetica]AKX96151.1 N,N'-diacetyllegionaminic acid synthase [Moorella thermoacetica]OIQ55363.1 N,N'-diacetyllegionaminic acid synthase [Moorella thermoacetica]QCZ99961.1 N,N'-diacetyllegionaminic acid synthase [Moorella thermoacetica]TYL07385.1 N,N'-diacetyllegionaminic acid synthase [Moorella thermoacetica]
MFNRVFIIAEAGVNHNGDLQLARKLVDAAVEAGADAVKFQTFKAEEVATPGAERAQYQKDNMPGKDESQLEMIKRLELSYAQFRELYAYCRQKGIIFLSSPFDQESIDFLAELGVPYFKIPSGEITNYPFLRRIGGKKRPVILSTGMATLGEVEGALRVLREAGASDITLLHCTTSYPAPPEEVNLRAMLTMKHAFALPVGYSDHTEGIAVPIAAAALGAEVIEKHLTVDRNLPGPDHRASLEPGEFKEMVVAIRQVEKSLGDGIKRPAPGELAVMPAARRSLVAARDIAAGEIITDSCLTAKRPGTGIPPNLWDVVVGRQARRDIAAGSILSWDMI